MSRKWTDEQLGKNMHYDPLAEAEQVTGQGYKEDKATGFLGLELALRHGDAKRRMLEDAGDTHGSMPLADYLAVVRRMGFEQVLCVPFQGREHSDEFQIWWDARRGLLLAFDTYFDKKSVNGGHVYYQWRPAEAINRRYLMSSGSFTEGGVWIGDHDCREGLCFNMRQLEQNGQFVVPWIKPQRLWLVHYADLLRDNNRWRENDEIIKRVVAERVAALPDHVRKAICAGQGVSA